ncbi:hypothetical protein [Bdellovibrio sp. NC01]|uniref:hypothetical protein n=1 Tax=Bdellovibrio sp. NC01 TaxID=2220073 RepID=UPI001AF013E9|nr:hypothetical protein [Bdellovibrio sp. NC01]
MNLKYLFTLTSCLVMTAACSQGPLSSNWQSSSSTQSNSSQSLTNPYTDQALTILQTNCSSCHGTTGGSGNVYGLSDISHMVSAGLIVPGNPNQSLLYNEIVSNSMPPGNPLSTTDRQVIQEWIAGVNSGGDNNNSGVTPTPTPTPSPSPSPSPTPLPTPTPSPTPAPTPTPTNPNATYSYISKNILQVSCTGCHSSLKTYSGTMKYVSAKNPGASTLYTEVNSGAMPRGSSKLSSASIKAIKDWITAGAANN